MKIDVTEGSRIDVGSELAFASLGPVQFLQCKCVWTSVRAVPPHLTLPSRRVDGFAKLTDIEIFLGRNSVSLPIAELDLGIGGRSRGTPRRLFRPLAVRRHEFLNLACTISDIQRLATSFFVCNVTDEESKNLPSSFMHPSSF